MNLNRKYPAIVVLLIVTIAASSAMGFKPPEPKYHNLQVLPAGISSKELQGIMVDEFDDGLGVSCGFCHADAADKHGLDYASDQKPEKEIARKMMRLTLGINRKYFRVRHASIGSSKLAVTCTTCHHGTAFPGGGESTP